MVNLQEGETRKGPKCKRGSLPWPAQDRVCLNAEGQRISSESFPQEEHSSFFGRKWMNWHWGWYWSSSSISQIVALWKQANPIPKPPPVGGFHTKTSVKSKEEHWQKEVGGSSQALVCSSKASDSKTPRKWHDKRLPWEVSSACSQGSCWLPPRSLSAQVIPPWWDLGSVLEACANGREKASWAFWPWENICFGLCSGVKGAFRILGLSWLDQQPPVLRKEVWVPRLS